MITDVKPYNLGIPVDPAAVTYPTVPEQVQAIVKCASTWNMKVQARSGGHSYGNYGTGGGDQDTIVVDLKNMKNVTWDNTEVANVGAGILLSELTETFLKDGNRAIAHGTCPQVGLGGHATIGKKNYTQLWGHEKTLTSLLQEAWAQHLVCGGRLSIMSSERP
jgi:FAD/FMN-containing dehydrogenase